MNLSEVNTAKEKDGVIFQKRKYKPSRYEIICDPHVVTAPFDIDLDEDKCIGCAVCIRQCPSQVLSMARREKPSRRQLPACQFNCPIGVDVRGYVRIISEGGSFEEAWRIITLKNPFPAVTGRVCPHPCENSCNRTYLDKPLNINCLERAIGDYGIEKDLGFRLDDERKKEKIAVVGSGPSGMSCAYKLAKLGYHVSIFESKGKAGGMLRYAIPSYRLPVSIVEKEILRILDMGVQLNLDCALGRNITLDELKKKFNAVYIATGTQKSSLPDINGNIADNLIDGLKLLGLLKEGEKLNLGKRVLVIGGGNTAVDAARSVARKGSDVTILYRRTMSEMTALTEEINSAVEEGVKIEFLCSPVEVRKKGKNTILVCRKMRLDIPDSSGRPRPVGIDGSDFEICFDTLVTATGQKTDISGFENLTNEVGLIVTDSKGRTQMDNVFAGGDVTNGPSLVSNAIGAGVRAAAAIDDFIQGMNKENEEKIEISYKDVPLKGLLHFKEQAIIKRNEKEKHSVGSRMKRFDNDENLPFTQDQVTAETKRCIGCGLYKPEYTTIRNVLHFGKVCLACHNCGPVCAQGAISMPHFYRVDEGRWATEHGVPVDIRDGMPNPLGLPHPVPMDEIRQEITDTEYVIFTRRSTRVFKPDAIPRMIIERVLEAGRFAPTAGNCQGYKFVVITDRLLMDEISRTTARFLGRFALLYQKKRDREHTYEKTAQYPFTQLKRPQANGRHLWPYFSTIRKRTNKHIL